MRRATEIQQAAQITVTPTSCARSGVRVTVISHVVSRDVDVGIGLGDTVVNRTGGTVVIRIGATTVKAPRIAWVIPCVLMTRAAEIKQSAEIAVAPGRCSCSRVEITVIFGSGACIGRDADRGVARNDVSRPSAC